MFENAQMFEGVGNFISVHDSRPTGGNMKHQRQRTPSPTPVVASIYAGGGSTSAPAGER